MFLILRVKEQGSRLPTSFLDKVAVNIVYNI